MDIPLRREHAETGSSDFPKRQKIFHRGELPTARRGIYTIAWICALPIEMAAARAVLDEIHESLPTHAEDTNTYVLGNIQGHNVVIACLPTDQYGIVNAANVVTNMKRTFTAIRVGLMVGIGGGVPSKVDIRLGDIVVGTRVMQADLGKIIGGEQLERTAIPKIPHQSLGTAVSSLRAKHELGPSRVPSILELKLKRYGYCRPSSPDRLFYATYHHEVPTSNCDICDSSKLVLRSARLSNDPVIHYGAIASGSQVIKNSVFRDEAARQLNVICFEMEAAGLMDILPCLTIRGICDYSDSHKSKEWQRYAAATAAAYARELLEELPMTEMHIKEVHTSLPDQSLSQERREFLLDSLRFEQIDARKSTIKAAHEKTCQWFLNHPDYKAWLEPEKLTQHHGFLWISGKPGAGKSTIMKFAYLKMKKKARREHAVTASFFFNARGEYLEKSVLGMYRSLLLQLLEGYPDLQTILDDPELVSTKSQNACPSLDVLKGLFHKAVPMLGQRSFTCFIDALDECDEQQVLDMIQHFEDLGERSAAKGVPFRVCFSSRHYPYIIIRRGTRLTLEHQSGHAEDLEAYIKGKLRAEDSEIIQKLLLKAAGVFMWVVLVVEILNKEYARGAMSLDRRLEELPSGLSDLFKDILKRDKENMEELLLCFLWILCAEHPLQPEEFYHALWSGLSLKGLVDSRIPDASVQDTKDGLSRSHRYVISSSKGLAEITRSKKPSVQFIHESVRDFLVKDRGLYKLWPELGLDWESPSHDKLKHSCSVYMTHYDVRESVSKLLPKPKSDSRTEISTKYPFLEYASHNVLYHANAATRVVPQDDFLYSFHLTNWIGISNLFEKTKIREYTLNASLLYILADRGYPELIRTRLKKDPEIHVLGERYKYPLFAALAHGDKASFAALLNLSSSIHDGVDVTEGLDHRKDLVEYKNRTPISWAAENGRAGIVNILLQRGMAVNGVDPDGHSLLSLALKNGHDSVAMLLVNKGADVNTSDPNGWSPLLQALDKCHETIAMLLIDREAAINSIDPYRRTALHWASAKGNDELARLLLDRGADVNASDRFGRTALHLASENGHKELARLLLDRGVDINVSDGSRRTALHWALENGYKELARLLLDRGADINASDRFRRTALHWASENGHKELARLLLDRGADINASDASRRTALHWASEKGNDELARLLLDRGADINASDASRRTALHWASEKGNDELARLLLDRGADVNASSQFGRTALHLASENGHEELARLLLDRGADINASDGSRRTALHWASEKGYKELARLLLDRGVDINASDRLGRAALHWASENGHEELARLLLDRGADINASDGSRRTALHWASENGYKELARLLLGRGASGASSRPRSRCQC
ncbi:unnamed protein product [Penicillium glandicola]